jgi:NADPH-dependent glutamate synthase beta subunit-like oxidoreductase
VAIGQSIDAASFEASGITTRRGVFVTEPTLAAGNQEGLFIGGDCVSEPATVIRAVAAGKTAALNIDEFLGFNHTIQSGVEVPPALFRGREYCARSNMAELINPDLAGNYEQVEEGLLPEEVLQEVSRCLRCDHFGSGAFRERRALKW